METIMAVAFAAGVVATVNPCGFAMLPAYLGYLLGADQERSGVLKVGLAVSAGFLAVFVVAGTVITAGLRSVIHVIPWMAALIGLALVFAGIVQLRGRRLLPGLPTPSRARKSKTLAGMFGFGVSYAVASLSCTLPIFLSLLAGGIAGASFGQAVGTFVVYGAGMALAVLTITVAVGIGREGLLARIRPIARRLDQIGGWVMIAAGVFIVWYWATVLGSGGTALATVGPVRWMDQVAASVAQRVAADPWQIAAGSGGLILLWWWLGNRSQSSVSAGHLTPIEPIDPQAPSISGGQ